jgi:hypothetical protein
MAKTQAYKDYEKEEWQLVRVVDFLSTKLALKQNPLDGPTLTNLARAIKNSLAFRKTLRNTSLSRLKRHISYLVHRGAVAGKRMSTRGIVPENGAEAFAAALVNQAQLSDVRDTGKLTTVVDSYTRTGKELTKKLDKLVKSAA